MAKKVVKEIIIVLLLCLAIILLLGVLLYEYIPNNQLIPEKVSYMTPENVKEELNKSDEVDESQVILTYQVDSTDLNNYKRINNYVPGKKNPFSTYEVNNNSEGNTAGSNGSTTGNNSGNGSTSEGKLFNNKGTK